MEEPILFQYYDEIDVRPAFDDQCVITLANFESLVGEYRPLDDEVSCQVQRQEGLCGHKHRNGWVGRRKDGKEALIGIDCANKYFKADEKFGRERSRVRSALAIKNYLARLQESLGDRPEFKGRVRGLVDRLNSITTSFTSVRRSLPYSVTRRLSDMAKTGNNAVIVELKYVEKDENGKEKISWVQQPMGTVSGVQIWIPEVASAVHAELKKAHIAADQAELTEAAGEKVLKGWVAAVEALPGLAVQVVECERQLERFLNPANLKLLCLLTGDQQEQLDVARAVLMCGDGSVDPSRQDVESLRKEIHMAVRTQHQGRVFRIV